MIVVCLLRSLLFFVCLLCGWCSFDNSLFDFGLLLVEFVVLDGGFVVVVFVGLFRCFDFWFCRFVNCLLGFVV